MSICGDFVNFASNDLRNSHLIAGIAAIGGSFILASNSSIYSTNRTLIIVGLLVKC